MVASYMIIGDSRLVLGLRCLQESRSTPIVCVRLVHGATSSVL